MEYIDAKFKDCDPRETVEKIRGILAELGIEVTEKWNDSGVENCYSLLVCGKSGLPSSNGKGITREFARASAYAEFIERIQGGLYCNRLQSFRRRREADIHTYAPDCKYYTVDELIQDGQWMDHIIAAYPHMGLTREALANQCAAYSCVDDGKILMLPFYSLFEDKHVYLPIRFVDAIYGTNGCCAGNTREEAWVHAMSEMMERHASVRMLISGKAAPVIPEEVLQQFPTVSHIFRQIRENGCFDIQVFDYSIGNGFPIVSTRIINKKNQNYRINVAADPVFEIALHRTLTELFQGLNIQNFVTNPNSRVLKNIGDYSLSHNVTAQLENGRGMYTADYFANELTCVEPPAQYTDNSGKTNKELLSYMLELYRQLGKPVYVRNFSYLGFQSYRFVVPGFSEALFVRLDEIVPEYAIADGISVTLRDLAAASDDDLAWMLQYFSSVRGLASRYDRFDNLAGVPLTEKQTMLARLAQAYGSYRLKNTADAISYTYAAVCAARSEQDQNYLRCVGKYLEMKRDGVEEDKIALILNKFFEEKYPRLLMENLSQGKTPYDSYLLKCDYESCQGCAYRQSCAYESLCGLVQKAAPSYRRFTDGQDRSRLSI